MKRTISIVFVGMCLAVSAAAQFAKPVAEEVKSTEKITKGSPFSADAVTENIRMLADGNRIVQSSTSKLYRDAEGRYRRDDNKRQLGLPGANVEVPESIMIIDPTIGVRYTLDVKRKTYRESSVKGGFELKRTIENDSMRLKIEKQAESRAEQNEKRAEARSEMAEQRARLGEQGRAVPARPVQKASPVTERGTPGASTTEEDLGTRVIEGVNAEGKRSTVIIPAGSIGNDREITATYERWYSAELMMTVYSKHVDPRFGEQTYQLKNISRVEPSSSLFAPPADYNAGPSKPLLRTGEPPKPPKFDLKAPKPPTGPKPVEAKKPGAKPTPPVVGVARS